MTAAWSDDDMSDAATVIPGARARGNAPRVARWAVACALVPHGSVAQEPSAAVRLQAGWISREPGLPPPSSLKAAPEAGWPEAGSRVWWLAHVLNRGTATAAAVPFVWRIDGEAVADGTADLAPGETVVRFPWDWTFDRHVISFELQPAPETGDDDRDDDSVTVASDALGLGFWIERGAYDWMAEGGRPGFERWVQREIERWNRILERAVYPTTPRGVLDRIRLERVVVLPEGSRPRNDELDTDLFWFFPSQNDNPRFLQRGVMPSDGTIVLHEVLHLRGLIDLYAYAVTDGDRAGSRVDITENGRRVAGTPLMPPVAQTQNGTLVYRSPANGIMGTRYVFWADLTEHCANGLNLHAGRRTPIWLDQAGNVIVGYSNGADPEGYVWRLPRQTEMLLVDQQGASIPGAAVDVYLDHSPHTYQKLYPATPDRTLAADVRGVAVLPGDVLNGLPSRTAPPKALVIILGVRTDHGRGFAFLPVYDLNLLYFRGGVERAESVLPVTLHPW